MKKQKMQLIILVVLCVLCIGGYFLIRNAEFKTGEVTDTTETVYITDFAEEDAVEVLVEGENPLHFVKENDTWYFADDKETPVDQDSVNAILQNVDNISTTEEIIESPEDLSAYGLETPHNTATITLSDGATVIIKCGDKNDLVSKSYVQIDGDTNVYLVYSYVATGFEKTAEEFVYVEETETETETILSEETE